MPHVGSTVPTVRDDCLAQPPQLELVGHSIVSSFYFVPRFIASCMVQLR